MEAEKLAEEKLKENSLQVTTSSLKSIEEKEIINLLKK